jgi:C-terminal processing protease CtpA/Prc
VESAITNPVAFAKSRFTGGIGAIMLADPNTGRTVIHQVIAGSPAEAAGLRDGDVVLKVNGVSTTGQKLAQVVDSVRGFVASSVTLTIQRTGSTNLECVLRRSSWNRLGVPQ